MLLKQKIKKIISALFTLIILPLFFLLHDDDPLFMHNIHYLLDVENAIKDTSESDADFDYYKLPGKFTPNGEETQYDQYAIALQNMSLVNATIPTEHNGGKVTAIWPRGFAKSSSLRTINFFNNSGVSYIHTIDYEAFLGCKALTGVTLPYTISYLGEAAFYNCSALSMVKMLSNDTDDVNASASCTFSTGTPTYHSSLQSIPKYCFYQCTSLSSLTLPSFLQKLEEESFFKCSNLVNITFRDAFRQIEAHAFEQCTGLRNIYLASSFLGKPGVIKKYAFNGCDTALTVHISDTSSQYTTWNTTNSGWNLNSITSSSTITADVSNSTKTFEGLWSYTISNNKATVDGFIGATTNLSFISFPDYVPGTTTPVTAISPSVIEQFGSTLERLYLPTTLESIQDNFLGGKDTLKFPNLGVIDSNKHCTDGEDDDYRVNLIEMTNLKTIGTYAVSNMGKYAQITKLTLPSEKLETINSFAFYDDSSKKRFAKNVKEFKWDLENSNKLTTIKKNAFNLLGNFNTTNTNQIGVVCNHKKSDGTNNYELMDLVFPASFTNLGNANNSSDDDRVFAGCPLIRSVLFKGGSNDLVIGREALAFCQSLRTVIFEERPNKTITFFSRNARDYADTKNYKQTSIGNTAGYKETDFHGNSGLQTLCLPNTSTNLSFDKNAFLGNSRATIYLSNTKTNKISYSNSSSGSWNNIGVEDSSSNKTEALSTGFWFNGENSFGIQQKIPVYENVHFQGMMADLNPDGAERDIAIDFGSSSSANTLKRIDKKMYIYNSTNATFTNYLYDRYSNNSTCEVDSTVESKSVTAIGDSAFSDDYTDSSKYTFNASSELTRVKLPNTITSIGDYAFFRAYGITEVTTGNSNTYTMPTSLTSIGRLSFAFCGIQQVLNIPSTCNFYETSNAVYNVASTFSNSWDLRKVTFLTGSKYSTTEYEHSTGVNYTSAIYSDGTVSYNKNRLLFVLARDSGDKFKVANDTTNAGKFTPVKNTQSFLYGAFKIAKWITSLQVNYYTRSAESSGSVYAQPLFSGIKKGTLLYLRTEINYKTNNSNESILTTLAVPTGTALPEYGFDGCQKLSGIEFPYNSGGNIPEGVFKNNTSLVNYISPYDSSNTSLTRNGGTLNGANKLDLSLTGYTSIGAEAFYGNTNLQQLKLSAANNSSLTVGSSAFASCGLTTATLTAGNSSTLTLNSSALSDNTSLTSVNISCGTNSTINIGENAIKGATNLASISISCPASSKVVLGKSAFENCNALTSLDLSGVLGEIEIGASCFTGGTRNSTTISWPTSCTKLTIGDSSASSVFKGIKAPTINGKQTLDLSAITGDVYIEKKAFENHGMQKLILPSTVKSIGVSAFQSCKSLTTIEVPTAITSITELEDSAFNTCTALESFPFNKFPNLTELGQKAFSSALSGDITLPSLITTIGKECFSSSKITSFKVTGSDLTLGASTFASCTNLTKFEITDLDMTLSIGAGTFDSCTSLTSIMLPSTFNLASNTQILAGTNFNNANTYVFLGHNNPVSTFGDWTKIGTANTVENVCYYALNGSGVVNCSSGYKYWGYVGSTPTYLGTFTSSAGNTYTFSTGTYSFSNGTFTLV